MKVLLLVILAGVNTNRIREVRESLGLRRYAVARGIGKSPSWLWTVEEGLLEPKPEDRAKIAEALKTDEAVLFPEGS